jgi:hypothetical protein
VDEVLTQIVAVDDVDIPAVDDPNEPKERDG